MRIFIAVVILALLSLFANGQIITFQKQYSVTANALASFNCASQTSDGGYIICGKANTGNDFLVVKTNAHGQVSWAKSLGDGNNSTSSIGFKVGEVPGGGYYVMGARDQNVSSAGLSLIRLDATGNILWNKAYAAPGSDILLVQHCSIRTVPNGGFALTATYYQQNWGYILFIKTDSNGNITWTKRFFPPATLKVHGQDIEVMPENGPVTAIGGDLDIYAVSCDNTGNLLWAKEYSDTNPNTTLQGYAMTKTSDGGYVILSSLMSFTANLSMVPALTKIDGNGNVIWSKVYSGNNLEIPSSHYANVVQAQDGGFMFTSMYSSLPVLIKTSSNGSFQWAKYYNIAGGSIPYVSAKRTADGGCVLAYGTMKPQLIKTDASGYAGCFTNTITVKDSSIFLTTAISSSVAPGINVSTVSSSATTVSVTIPDSCGTIIIVESLKESEKETGMAVYPNPSTGKFKTDIAGNSLKCIEIYNLQGQKIFEADLRAIKNEQEIDLSSQPNGVYILKTEMSGGNINYTRLIKQQ